MLAREKIGPLLWKLSFPAIIGMMVHALYNIIDAIFVGHFVGTLGIGGIAIVFPIQMILMAVGMTIGIGGASLISRRMGANDHESSSFVLGNIVTLSFLCGLICLVIGLMAFDAILILFGANEALIPYSRAYLLVILLGSPIIIFSLSSNSAVRAEGNAKVAMTTMIIGSVINILLDPVFIIFLKLGVRGAAIATVLSISFSALFLVLYFFSGKSELKLRLKYLRLKWSFVKEIFAIGLSDFVRSVAMSLTSALFNNTLRSLGGEVPIAAFGIIFRIVSFFFMPMMGIAMGAQPIIGFNFGAQKYDRVREGFRFSNISVTIIAVLGFLILFVFSEQIFGIFTGDPELISTGKDCT